MCSSCVVKQTVYRIHQRGNAPSFPQWASHLRLLPLAAFRRSEENCAGLAASCNRASESGFGFEFSQAKNKSFDSRASSIPIVSGRKILFANRLLYYKNKNTKQCIFSFIRIICSDSFVKYVNIVRCITIYHT